MTHSGKSHPSTPSRAVIFAARYFKQELGVQIKQEELAKLTGISARAQRRILASNHVRSFHNQSEVDIRGVKRQFTRQDSTAVADYLDDPDTSIKEKEAP